MGEVPLYRGGGDADVCELGKPAKLWTPGLTRCTC